MDLDLVSGFEFRVAGPPQPIVDHTQTRSETCTRLCLIERHSRDTGIQQHSNFLDSGARFSLRLISRRLKLYRQLGRNDA
jgi:hypothetical protein